MSNRPIRPRTDFIVVHCSATRANWNGGAADIDTMHRKLGWDGIGYHFVIRRDGRIEVGEDLKKVGSHVQNWNSVSVGICMVGGLAEDGKKGENNFTPEQWVSLKRQVQALKLTYPEAKLVGHRDLSPDKNGDGVIRSNEWLKECPCFSVTDWEASRYVPPVGKANSLDVKTPKKVK